MNLADFEISADDLRSCGDPECCGDGPVFGLRCSICDENLHGAYGGMNLDELNKLAYSHQCDQLKKLVVTARELARKVHAGQTHGEQNQSYFDGHLYKVASEMSRIIDKDETLGAYRYVLIAAAWLHDSLEDTALTYMELVQACGVEVANLVQAVTDEKGANRKERKAKTYPKTKSFGKLAVAVKLADRLANVRGATFSRKNFLKMYKEEQPGFEEALRTPGELDLAWHEVNWLLPKPKDETGYYIVVTGDFAEYTKWCSHKNLEHPNQAVQLSSGDMFRVFGLSAEHWRVVVLPSSNAETVKKLIERGYKTL